MCAVMRIAIEHQDLGGVKVGRVMPSGRKAAVHLAWFTRGAPRKKLPPRMLAVSSAPANQLQPISSSQLQCSVVCILCQQALCLRTCLRSACACGQGPWPSDTLVRQEAGCTAVEARLCRLCRTAAAPTYWQLAHHCPGQTGVCGTVSVPQVVYFWCKATAGDFGGLLCMLSWYAVPDGCLLALLFCCHAMAVAMRGACFDRYMIGTTATWVSVRTAAAAQL